MTDNRTTELLREMRLKLPLIDSDTKLVHAIYCEIDGEPAYGFEEMTANEYVERFNVPILENGWPNGMSVIDMGLSLRAIGKEYADAFVDAMFGEVDG